MMRWLATEETAPRRVFITHGEPEAAFAFAGQIERELGWTTDVPCLGETAEL